MLPTAARLTLVIFALGAATLLFASGRWTGTLFLVVAGLLIWGHFRIGPVRRAYAALERGQLERAARLIGRAGPPERLREADRAHYHYVVGMLAGERGDMETAERSLDLALSGPKVTSNERAQVSCYLAELALGRGDLDAARRQLDRARAQTHDAEVERTIAELADLIGDGKGEESR